MPEQEPTPWELLRAINRIESSIQQYSARFDQLVPQVLFQAYQLEVSRRFAELKEDAERRRANHERDIAGLQEQRQRDEEARRQLKLLVFTALVTAVFGFVASLILRATGGGT